MKDYKVILHPIVWKKVEDYYNALVTGEQKAGKYLRQKLLEIDLNTLDLEIFLEKLLQTKKPQIFAESAIKGKGKDWNDIELSILGDISIAVNVEVYDNGRHSLPKVHAEPFDATLLYVPGALLRSSTIAQTVDEQEVVYQGRIDLNAYYHLYERRLLPVLKYANDIAKSEDKEVLITIPGLGCGMFAGVYKGQLGECLNKAIYNIIEKHGSDLSHIKAVYYDPYNECSIETHRLGNIEYLVRPLLRVNTPKPQLSHPNTFSEGSLDFSGCRLFSVVAWDHVSWPGNDFYVGSRATDDGVKAAATSSMQHVVGVKGKYNPKRYTYDPPTEFKTWDTLIKAYGIDLEINDNLLIMA